MYQTVQIGNNIETLGSTNQVSCIKIISNLKSFSKSQAVCTWSYTVDLIPTILDSVIAFDWQGVGLLVRERCSGIWSNCIAKLCVFHTRRQRYRQEDQLKQLWDEVRVKARILPTFTDLKARKHCNTSKTKVLLLLGEIEIFINKFWWKNPLHLRMVAFKRDLFL